MARRFDLTGLADDLLGQWERRPVILARSVRTARGAELAAPLRDGETLSVAAARLSEAGPSQANGTGGGAQTPIDDVSEIVTSNDKLVLVGRPVTFARVTVQRVAGVRSFWAGDTRTQRVFIVVDAMSVTQAIGSARGLKTGDIVTIAGTVERVPGVLGQVKVTSWGRLDDADAQALSERDVYVYAKSVRVLPQPPQ